MIVQIIHNPASGTYSENRLSALVQAFQACGAEVIVGQTNVRGDPIIKPDCDLICVAGGDGSLRIVVSELAANKMKIPLCVFPAGTVNLVAKELGYASDPELFAREVIAGFLKPDSRLSAPVITSDGRAFVACLSAGPDGVAVATYSSRLKKRIGGAAYAISLLNLLFSWPKHHFALELKTANGEKMNISCGAFYVVKGHHYAGNWTLAPDANLASPHFHLLTLSSASRRNFMRFIVQIALNKDPASLGFVEKYTAMSVSVKQSGPDTRPAFQVDGDIMIDIPKIILMSDDIAEYCKPVPA